MMKNLAFSLVLLFVLMCSQSAFSQMVYRGTVVEIVDGRTVVIEIGTRNHRLTVQLQHIEVPEPGQQLHQTVREHLGKLLLGKQVEYQANRLELTKTVGQVLTTDGGVDASLQMLRDGAAWLAPIPSGEPQPQPQRADENYRSVETQARLEKRGVWSIPNLKPAWEFRAERDKVNQPADSVTKNDAAKDQNEFATVSGAANGSRRQPMRRPAAAPNTNVEMWADVNDYSKIKESVYSTGLVAAYNKFKNWGYLSTPDAVFDIPAGGVVNYAAYRVGYYHPGNQLNPGEERFLFLMSAHSKKSTFPASSNMMLVADGRKINLIKHKRLEERYGSGDVLEILFYQVSRAALMKIAAAKKVEMKFGAYSSPLSAKQQKLIKTLLADTE